MQKHKSGDNLKETVHNNNTEIIFQNVIHTNKVIKANKCVYTNKLNPLLSFICRVKY